jgi:hypothetical protein
VHLNAHTIDGPLDHRGRADAGSEGTRTSPLSGMQRTRHIF